jgi:hypothetical protein
MPVEICIFKCSNFKRKTFEFEPKIEAEYKSPLCLHVHPALPCAAAAVAAGVINDVALVCGITMVLVCVCAIALQ